jgi:hypothetical protein
MVFITGGAPDSGADHHRRLDLPTVRVVILNAKVRESLFWTANAKRREFSCFAASVRIFDGEGGAWVPVRGVSASTTSVSFRPMRLAIWVS